MTESTAERLLTTARAKGLKIATAESCTGGMIGAALTDIAGSSDVFDRGFITYSNAAKQDMLGVPANSLRDHGAVSETVAKEMAFGAIVHSAADISVSVTGVAGPGGGTDDKPVGTVWFGIAEIGKAPTAFCRQFGPLARAEIRESTVTEAIKALLHTLAP